MSDFVDIRSKQLGQRSEDSEEEYVIAAMCDDSRLFFVLDQALDVDIQPSPADFSITVGGTKHSVQACSLKGDICQGQRWSLISLMLNQSFEPGMEISFNYHPEQWFLCAVDDESIEPFQATLTLENIDALPGVNLGVGPAVVETVQDVSAPADPGARLAFAHGRSIKITFSQKLNFAFRPQAGCFRAESSDQWLDIAKVHLARGSAGEQGKAWPELWLMLRRPLRDGSEVEIAYKPSEKGLTTAEGATVSAFRVHGLVAEEQDTQEQDHQDPKPADKAGEVSMEMHGTWIKPLPITAVTATWSEEQPEEQVEEESAESEDEKTSPAQTSASLTLDDHPLIATAGQSLKGLDPKPAVTVVAKQFKAPPPGQVLRTYLATGEQVTVDESAARRARNLDFGVTADTVMAEDEKEGIRQRFKKSSWWVKLSLGSGFVFVFAVVAGLFTVTMKIASGGFTSEAPDLLAVSSTGGRQDCEMTYHDGSHYSGQCNGKKRDGRGRYEWRSGDSYSGSWKNDKMHGKGVLKYRNGDMYKGAFANNLKHGTGAMNWANGARYQGGYKRGKLHGQGTYWNVDGKRFEGEFQNGATTNNGTCYFVDGTRQAGACP